MTYIIVLHGDGERLVANADCGAGVLRNWLLLQVRQSLPKSSGGGSWQLDLCDTDGGLRLLSALPATCRGLDALSAGGTYRAVARSGEPSALFRWLGGAPEPEQIARLVRDQLGWELATLRQGDDAAPDLVLQTVLQVLESAKSSTAASLGRHLAKIGKEARTERLAALEEALGPLKKMQPDGQPKRQRTTSKGRSSASSRSASVKSSPQPPSLRSTTPR